MTQVLKLARGAICIFQAARITCEGKTLTFSGYDWTVKSGANLGPGPNNWDENNVWVDPQGELHLKLTNREVRWYCSQVGMRDRLSFGTYQFWIKPDRQTRSECVFGLFDYPTPDAGPDGTHEIDIEFAKWGVPYAKIGSYTVWPAKKGPDRANQRFAVDLNGSYTTHRFTWKATSVFFQSLHGHRDDNSIEFAEWLYEPRDPASQLGQQPVPVEINLWLFKGQPPQDGQEVELIVRSFKFIPM
jgi:hypothetical protein